MEGCRDGGRADRSLGAAHGKLSLLHGGLEHHLPVHQLVRHHRPAVMARAGELSVMTCKSEKVVSDDLHERESRQPWPPCGLAGCTLV